MRHRTESRDAAQRATDLSTAPHMNENNSCEISGAGKNSTQHADNKSDRNRPAQCRAGSTPHDTSAYAAGFAGTAAHERHYASTRLKRLDGGAPITDAG